MAVYIVTALFLLTGCGARGSKLASSFDDIAGAWRSNSGGEEYHFKEDGTFSYQKESSEHPGEFWFEGTQLFMKDLTGFCTQLVGVETGIYEVELLGSGNLKFTAIEDECPGRAGGYEGSSKEKEWEPIP
jgi:hypothetical protein